MTPSLHARGRSRQSGAGRRVNDGIIRIFNKNICAIRSSGVTAKSEEIVSSTVALKEDSALGDFYLVGLNRDASLIIPSIVPTQEALLNLSQYHSSSRDDNMNLESEIYGRGNPLAATISEEVSFIMPMPSTQSSTPSSFGHQEHAKEHSRTPCFRYSPEKTSEVSAEATSAVVEAASKREYDDENEDSDPIMDFEDTDEEQNQVQGNKSAKTGDVHMDSAFASSSKSTPPKFRQQNQSSPSYGTFQPFGLNSPQPPSRRFILPTTTTLGAGDPLGGVPYSPNKRLRPVSELPRPVVPLQPLVQKSASRKGTSPRKQRVAQVTSPKKSPSSETIEGLSVPGKYTKGLRPPPPLGPKLLRIANEGKRRQKQGLQQGDDEEMEKERPIRRSIQQKPGDLYPNPALNISNTMSISLLYDEPSPSPYVSSPEPEVTTPTRSKPNTASSLSTIVQDELKKQRLLAEVAAIRKPSIPLSISEGSSGLEPASAPIFEALAHTIKKEPLTPALLSTIPTLQQGSKAAPHQPPQSPQEPHGSERIVSYPLLTPPPPKLQQIKKPLPNIIPLPDIVLQFAPKLTPIEDIRWPPEKPGRFHILALVLFIGPENQVVIKEKQKVVAKCEITVCGLSAMPFKLNLWSSCCEWVQGQMFKVGDVVLVTDIRVKEFKQSTARGLTEKVSGNTSWWSRMARLDGSLLPLYRGNSTIESNLAIFIQKRRALAFDLLDKEKGIVKDSSIYVTLPLWSFTSQANEDQSLKEKDRVTISLNGDSAMETRRSKHGSKVTALVPIGSAAAVSAAQPNTKSVASTSRDVLPKHVTGVSIRVSVAYKLLMVAGDESQGWEIGSITPSGHFIRIQ
ncbi:hypothetical protein BX616_005138, partial [Lobosporangium transversale]